MNWIVPSEKVARRADHGVVGSRWIVTGAVALPLSFTIATRASPSSVQPTATASPSGLTLTLSANGGFARITFSMPDAARCAAATPLVALLHATAYRCPFQATPAPSIASSFANTTGSGSVACTEALRCAPDSPFGVQNSSTGLHGGAKNHAARNPFPFEAIIGAAAVP